MSTGDYAVIDYASLPVGVPTSMDTSLRVRDAPDYLRYGPGCTAWVITSKYFVPPAEHEYSPIRVPRSQ